MSMQEPGGAIRYYGVNFFAPGMLVGAYEEHRYRICLHMHDFLEVCVVLDGHCVHRTPDGDEHALPGSVFVLTPGALHGFLAGDEDDAHVVNLLFHRDFFVHYRADLAPMVAYSALFTVPNPHIASFVLSEQELAALAPYLLSLCRENRVHAFPVTHQNALGLLIVSMLCHMYAGRISETRIRRIPDHRLLRCIEYMNGHLAESVTVETLCELAFCSPSSLRRSFEALIGLSPTQYLTRLRLQRATELLQSTALPLSDIAQQCGFYDSAQFSRRFRAHAGLSPREYRRRYGGGR